MRFNDTKEVGFFSHLSHLTIYLQGLDENCAQTSDTREPKHLAYFDTTMNDWDKFGGVDDRKIKPL